MNVWVQSNCNLWTCSGPGCFVMIEVVSDILHLMLCVATAMTDIYACAENTPVMTTFMHADAEYEI